jgi:hypothetical protein
MADQTAAPTPHPILPLLLLLAADKVAPPSRPMQASTDVPCKDVKVQTKVLAQVLLASAFLGLRENGLVSLETYEKKKLFRMHTEVRVKATGEGHAVGFESSILGHVTGNPDKDSAVFVLVRWFGQEFPSPSAVVVANVRAAGKGLGLFQTVSTERGRIAGKLLGKERTEPVCAAIAAVAPQSDDAARRWLSFVSAEAERAEALLASAKRAIDQMTERDDSDDD